jgi:hypothetical protein
MSIFPPYELVEEIDIAAAAWPDIGLPSRPVPVSGVNRHEGYFAFAG